MGSGRQPYVDHSGAHWAGGNYCEGGENVAVPTQKIESTEDAALYLGGVRGIAHCVFPVTQKLYELHFHFAETTDLAAATRLASLSINAGPAIGVDVVDDAGGDGIATSIVVTGVAPENDGSIHVDFVSDISLLNAVEILPAPSASLLPVRIVVNSKPYVDSANPVLGVGPVLQRRPSRSTARISQARKPGTVRIGPRRTLPLQHSCCPHGSLPGEALLSRAMVCSEKNGGIGGPGSRVFDVACNGELLMKNFDILAADDSAPVVKTFDNIQASAGGKIELSFQPVVNYAVVNAIEVLPEN